MALQPVVTVLTVYGIETLKRFRMPKKYGSVVTVLTVYGIETQKETKSSNSNI